MKIYIDSDHLCHTSEAEEYREFDVSFFDGKCREFIDGYRYVPTGETWEREDGTIFRGEMISPWKDYNILSAAQRAYEESMEEIGELEDNLNIITGEVSINDESGSY